MHSAPSVTYPVGRSLFAGTLAAAAWLAGAGVLWAWGAAGAGWGWRQALAAGALAAAGGLAGWQWRQQRRGELAWDGAAWQGPGWTGTRLAVSLDLQQVLLVRCAGHWLWLERRSSPGRWDDLRRAVYSRAAPDAYSPGTLREPNP